MRDGNPAIGKRAGDERGRTHLRTFRTVVPRVQMRAFLWCSFFSPHFHLPPPHFQISISSSIPLPPPCISHPYPKVSHPRLPTVSVLIPTPPSRVACRHHFREKSGYAFAVLANEHSVVFSTNSTVHSVSRSLRRFRPSTFRDESMFFREPRKSERATQLWRIYPYLESLVIQDSLP